MTSLERLIAVSNGDVVDRAPLVCWPGASPEGDVVVVSIGELQSAKPTGDRAVFAHIQSPFGRSLAEGVDLNALHRESPEAGEAKLAEYIAATQAEIELAYAAGADGMIYALHGAVPNHCSPMQYGGLYLERDREILSAAKDRGFTLLFIVGDEEAYLDFVSDLPAHAIAWDVDRTGFTVSQMRELRSGAVCATDPESDIRLVPGLGGRSIAQALEGNGAFAHA